MKHFYPIIFLFFLLFFFTSNVQSQTINLVRFNNTANYTSGSGVSVLINPTGIFNLDNKFILELSDVGGNWASPTTLTTLDEFYVPVVNGTLPTGLSVGSYKLRIRSTSPVLTIETGTFNVVSGSGIGVPNFKSNLDNNTNSEFTCLGECSPSNNIFGDLTVAANSNTSIINTYGRTNIICNNVSGAVYSVNLINISNSSITSIPIDGSWNFEIPDNLNIGTYVFELESKKSGLSSIFSNIFIFHGNATSLTNSSSETVCVGNNVGFTIVTDQSGIGRNYMGSKYSMNFGDGSPTLYFTQAELLSNNNISHVFNTVSCSLVSSVGVGYYEVKTKLFNKGIYKSNSNSNYCNAYYENGDGKIAKVNTNKAPVADFTVAPNQCINTSISSTNTTTLGQFGTSTCLNEAKYFWYYKKPSSATYISVPISSPWIVNGNLIIPPSEVNESGCWSIKLNAQNAGAGCTTTTEKIKNIKIETVLDPTFTNTPASPICPNVAIQFTDTTVIPSSGCQDLTYSWIIKKNEVIVTSTEVQAVAPSTLNSPSPLIKFIQPGIYMVTLDITNSCGTKSSVPKEIVVNGAPTVSFSPGSLSVCNSSPSYTLDFAQSPIKPVYSVAPYAPNSYLWTITGTGVTAADYSFIGGTTNSSAYPQIIFNAFKTYIIKAKVDGNCSGSNEAVFTFALKEIPVLTNTNLTQTICSDNSTTSLSLTSSMIGTTFSWTVTGTSNISSVPISGNGNSIPSATLNNSSNSVGTIYYAITPSIGGCSGAVVNYVITVAPKPFVSQLTKTICTGTVFSVTPVNGGGNIVPSPTTYTWSVPVSNPINAITGGSAQATGIATISQTLTNTTNTSATLTYTVTPASGTTGNCVGASFTITVIVNPTPTSITLSNKEFCNGVEATSIIFSNAVAGTTYIWTNSNPAIGLPANGTGNIPSFTATNTEVASITSTISVTPTANGCPGVTQTFTITVNPSPEVTFSPSNQTICSGDSSISVTLNSVISGVTYTWTAVQPTGITGVTTSGTDTIPIQTLVNSTNAPITITYSATGALSGSASCLGATYDYSITVNPMGQLIQPIDLVVCNSQIASVTFTSTNTAGTTTYSWTNNDSSINLPATGTGNISFTASNTTTTPKTATIIVTPTFTNGGKSCIGTSSSFIIKVNPVGQVDQPLSQVVCNGDATSAISFSSVDTGIITAYSWVNNAPSIGLTASGNTDISSFNAINNGTTPIVATIIVTPTFSNGSVNCAGATKTFSITVNPTAQVTQPLDKVICNNQAASVIFTSANTGGTTTYSWTNNDSSINLPATGTGDISFTASNATVIPIVATIVVTPTFTNGGKSCSGTPKTFTITVNPTLTVDLPDNQEVCNGFSTNAIVFTGAIPNTVYNWTNTNATIGIGASGVGNIPVFTAINNGINPITTSITVTPSLNGCFGLPKTFTITVNPSPAVTFSQPNQVICSGSSNTSVNLTSTTAGTAFSWTAIQPLGISGVVTSGGNSIPVQIVTNTTNEPIVVTYLAKAELNTGVSCEGATYNYTITVNPVPLINSQTATICSANAFNVIPQNGGGTIVPANTLYSWSSPIVSPIGAITGGSAQSVNQNSISQTLINVTDQLATATYIVTPKSGTCTGTPFTVVITVNPSAKVAFSKENQAICTGTNTLPVVLTSATTGNVTFNWIANVPAGITGVTSLTGTNTIPVQNLINTTTSPLIVTYTSTATLDNNGVSCKGAQFIYSIMVYAPIVITTNEEKDITCFGDADGKIAVTVTGGTTNYNYTWTKDNSPFATTEDISNLIPGVYTVTVSDTNNCGPETATFTITQPPVLALNWVGQTDVLCYGAATGAITVSTVGGTPIEITPSNFDYKYAWTGPNGFTSTNQNLSNVLAGAYDLTVTDNSGCFKKLSTTITQPDEIIITATTTPIICYGGNDASIKILISGGIAPYTINWSNLGGGDLQDNLSAGDYLVTVTDDNDCIKTLNVNIPEAPIFTVNPVVKNISCFGTNDGSINLNIIGGIAPLKLVWDDSAVAGNVRNNLRPGTYTVTISDGKPCTISRTFIILEPQKLVISANVTDAFDCDDANSGAINLLVSGGTTPFTYSWSNGVVTEDLSNIPAGNYSIIVTDARGCSEQAQYSINRQPPIVIGIETKTDFNCETKYVKQTFLAQVSGGFPPYQLVWSSGTVSGANNEIMNTTQNGTTILDVTDNLGCTSSYSFNVKNPVLGNPDFTTNSIGFSTYGIYSIIDPIQFTNTATGDFINIAWDFGDGSVSNEVNPIHSFVKEGIYVVNQTVTYPFGCIYTHIITLTVDKGYELMSPNGFTPNGDGINETFKPAFLGMKSIQLDVYDTWGELVYSETGETLQGWDGKVKGKESENGNYYYKVKATTFYGTIISKDGPFTLIK